MAINLTDSLNAATTKGKLGDAKQIYLNGDTKNLQQTYEETSTHFDTLDNRSTQLEKAIRDISATGGASTANAVSYNNSTSKLEAVTAQGAIDEVNSKLIYDVSAYNNGVVFESLQSLLSSSNLSTLIPTSVRHGGMTIRFIQSSHNRYVQYRQYRLMSNTFSTNESDWQGVDDEPTAGSNNLVKSGGVAENFNENLDDVKYNMSHKNLFINKFAIDMKIGYYISPKTGENAGTSVRDLFLSGYIPVNPNLCEHLTVSSSYGNMSDTLGWRFLDNNNIIISYGAWSGKPFTTIEIPSNAKSFQLSADACHMHHITIEYGRTPCTLDSRQSIIDEKDLYKYVNNISESYNFHDKATWVNFHIRDDKRWEDTRNAKTYIFYSITVPAPKGKKAIIKNNNSLGPISIWQLETDDMMGDRSASVVEGTSKIDLAADKSMEINILGNFINVLLGYRYVNETLKAVAPSIYVDGIDIMIHNSAEEIQKIKGLEEFKKHFCTGNLFDKDSTDILRHYIMAPKTGEISKTSYNVDVSPIMPVNEEDFISVSLQTPDNITEHISRGWRFLASDGETVLACGNNKQEKSFSIYVPEVNGVKPKYFQISYWHEYANFLVISYGNKIPGSYLYYGNQLTTIQKKFSESDIMKFSIPKTMLFAVGKSVGIYFNAITNDGVYDSPNYIDFNGLTISNRTNKAVYVNQGSASSGTVRVSIRRKGKDYKLSIPKLVIDGSSLRGTTVNILTIGDSYTEMGQYLDQINSCALSDGFSINWIGLMNSLGHNAMSENQTGGKLYKSFMQKRLSYSEYTAFCEGATYKVSVRGLTIKEYDINYGSYTGYKDSNNVIWWVKGYKLDSNGDGYLRLTANSTTARLPSSGTLKKDNSVGDSSVTYSSAELVNRNPLWNESDGTYSFEYYINKWGFASPDILLFMFSWNDLNNPWSTLEITTWIDSYFTPFVQKFHTEYPNAKVIFTIPGFGRTINPIKDIDGLKWNRQYLLQKLREGYDDVSYVQICPSYIFLDSENGYDGTNKVVNSLYPDYKPSLPNDSSFVHCNQSGMYEIGNSIYPYILNALQ